LKCFGREDLKSFRKDGGRREGESGGTGRARERQRLEVSKERGLMEDQLVCGMDGPAAEELESKKKSA